jgi:uncharacterized protein (DUF433 family)
MSHGVIIRKKRSKPSGSSRASKDWLFTLNNPEFPDTLPSVLTPVSRYYTYQLESGEQTGTIHFQGFLQLDSRRRLQYVKELLPTAHWEPRKGTVQQAIKYCQKEETRVSAGNTYGTPLFQGKRSDLTTYVEQIQEGNTDLQLLQSCPDSFARFPNIAPKIRRVVSQQRNKLILQHSRLVMVFQGLTGSGKSRFVWENFEFDDLFFKSLGGSKGSLFMDGYEGQPIAVFDEFLSSQFPITTLNQLLDRYPVNVQVKGSTTSWTPAVILILTNVSVDDWYTKIQEVHNEIYEALLRRIDYTFEFPYENQPFIKAMIDDHLKLFN